MTGWIFCRISRHGHPSGQKLVHVADGAFVDDEHRSRLCAELCRPGRRFGRGHWQFDDTLFPFVIITVNHKVYEIISFFHLILTLYCVICMSDLWSCRLILFSARIHPGMSA